LEVRNQTEGVVMKRILHLGVAICLMGSGWAAGSPEQSPIGKPVPEFSLPDWHGNARSLSEFRDSKLVVLAFLGTECPLAKIYAPRLEALAKEYASKGVAVVGIDSNLQDSITEIGAFARNLGLTFPILKDRDNELADRLGAQRTPEVMVLDRDRVIRYWGRIDDQYGFQTGAGYAKPRLMRSDLTEALNELLADQPVSQPITKADGCLIGRVKKPTPHGDVTYSNQIARILQNRCVECHRPGEVAPFSLTSYDEVVGWGEMIREVVTEERMPPWFANPAYGHFSNDARLTDAEKQAIVTWVENGCPQGDPSELPEPRRFVEGWQIGQPDQVIYIADEPYQVPAEGVVQYQYFTVDPGWTEDKWIKATECRPGDRSVVHHIIVFIDRQGAVSELGGRGGIGGYAPGSIPYMAPEGTAMFVPAGAKLRFQMHYTPNGTPREDRSCVGIIFADPKTVKRQLRSGVVGNVSFRIPAGADDHEVRAKRKFSRDTLLLSLVPHMHLRGKSFRYELEYADGSREILLDIPRWDFNWQLRYVLSEPKLIPKGSKLHCIAHFDNSENNLANPDPNSEVRFGDQTWEEMMFGFYTAIDPNEHVEIAADGNKSSQRGGE
jgi:peroxiredoxin